MTACSLALNPGTITNMDDELQFYLQKVELYWPFAAALLAIIVIFIIAHFFRRWKSGGEMRNVEQAIKSKSVAYMKDIVIPDGVYGYHFIDYLVVMPDCILIIGVQHNQGYIFGGSQIEQWTHVVNNRSYHFDNPLMKLNQYRQSLESLLPGANLAYKVVFLSDSSFPKGKPEDVVELDELANVLGEYAAMTPTTTPELMERWRELQESVKGHRKTYQQEISSISP